LEETRSKPNELVKFLEGTWITTDITITPSHEIKTAEYKEIMKIRDPETITITALGIDDGKDVTKDTIIRMNGDEVIMSQGDFSARGKKRELCIVQRNLSGPSIRFSFVLSGRQVHLPKRCLAKQQSHRNPDVLSSTPKQTTEAKTEGCGLSNEIEKRTKRTAEAKPTRMN
jgi:hypothetical protein